MSEFYSGSSPFIYKKDFKLNEQGHRSGVTLAYFNKCVATQRINEFDYRILQDLYKYSFLNRRMITVLNPDRSELSIKRCLSKLTDNGFIQRMYIASPNDKAPYVYCVTSQVAQFFAMNVNSVVRAIHSFRPDALFAIRTLAINQFILSMHEYEPIISEQGLTKTSWKERPLTLGYGVVLTLRGRRTRLVGIVVRRDEGWESDAISRVKLLFADRALTRTVTMPILICEDLVHIKELAIRIHGDATLADRTILFCTDQAAASECLLSHLYQCTDFDDHGNPVLSSSALV